MPPYFASNALALMSLRPISSGVVLSGVALSLNNCVLRCVLRVFVGVFEKLILFCGPERGEERDQLKE